MSITTSWKPLLALLGLGACYNPLLECVPVEIDDGDTGEEFRELCDGLDNNGDGRVDEGWPDYDDDGVADCAPPPEECNYGDDDYDGFVDEGFADTNGDGVPDCSDCPVDLPSAADVTQSCGGALYSPVGSPVIEFQWEGIDLGGPLYDDSPSPPYVSAMYDEDGDGDVDGDDTPLVAFRGSLFETFALDIPQSGALVLLNPAGGQDGLDEFIDDRFLAGSGASFPDMRDYLAPDSGHAVADLDGDGSPDLVMVDYSGNVEARAADGALLWQARDAQGNTVRVGVDYYLPVNTAGETPEVPVQPIVADLDGDGVAEVIVYDLIIDGETGVARALGVNTDVAITMAAVADVDLDGLQEILIGGDVFASDGTYLWSTDVLGAGLDGHWNAVVQADGDDEAEIIAVGGGELGLYEHDGVEIFRDTITTSAVAGPPCVADFDGDDAPEVAWGTPDDFVVVNLDGSLVWQASSVGVSVEDDGDRYERTPGRPETETVVPPGWAGCSGFDFDNDGAFEILFADERTFRVFDGATGAVLFTYTPHHSETQLSYPVVADWDLDGSAEILLASSNQTGDARAISGLTVFGDANDAWAPGGPSWTIHDFAATNAGPGGSVPGPEATYWLDANVYRARPGESPEPDLEVEIIDVCVESCELGASLANVSIQVRNAGAVRVDQAVVYLYGVDGAGQRIEPYLEVLTFTNLEAGRSTDARQVAFPAPSIPQLGIADLRVVIDRDDEVAECDEADNSHDWGASGDLCP